jgi:hypothetical protein
MHYAAKAWTAESGIGERNNFSVRPQILGGAIIHSVTVTIKKTAYLPNIPAV